MTLLRELQATNRLLQRAATQRHRLDAQKARTDMRDWAKARRERTRHLIELGGLVQKAGLVELVDDDRATLLGAFMRAGRPAAWRGRNRSPSPRRTLATPRPPRLRCRSGGGGDVRQHTRAGRPGHVKAYACAVAPDPWQARWGRSWGSSRCATGFSTRPGSPT